MNLEERKRLIYQTLRMNNKITYNNLWRELQREFKKKKDSFSNKTYDNMLKIMVQQGLVFRQEDKSSKLGKIWYLPVIDFPSIEDDVTNHMQTKIWYYNDQLKKFEKRFSNYDIYEKARRLGRFFILITLNEFSVKWFIETYPRNLEMKKRLKETRRMKQRLKKLFLRSKSNKDEIYQLVVKHFEADEQDVLNEIHRY